MGHPHLSRFILFAVILLLTGGLTPPPMAQAQDSTPTPAAGYTYIVKRGDNWTRISRQTGIPIAALKQNNPQAIHPKDWLNEGERLFVPGPSATSPSAPAAQDGGLWYQIKPGDSWGSVAKASGVSVQDLWSANPSKVNPNRWLFTGQWIWIPGPGAPSAPTGSAPTGAAPTATPQPTATASLTPMPTPTVAPEATAADAGAADLAAISQDTVDVAAQAIATVAAASQSAATVSAAAQSAATVVAAVNNIATAAAIAQSAATSIAVLSTQVAMLSGMTPPVTTAEAPAAPTATPAQAAPTVTAAATPTATAFATPTPLAATATRAATSTRAANVTATRAATNTRTLAATTTRIPTQTVSASGAGACLLDEVLAANQAFDRWGQEGFQEPIQLYWDAISDTAAKPCGKTAAQMEQLRDYARFRLLVSYVAGGQARQAPPLLDQIKDVTLKGAADTFLDGLKTSGSIVQSCRDVTEYVKRDATGWRWLGEMGLPAKPADVCPLG